MNWVHKLTSEEVDRVLDLEERSLNVFGENEYFLHGRCHILAIALSQVSAKPLTALIGDTENIGAECLVHAGVFVDGLLLDVKGLRTPDEAIEHDFCDEASSGWLQGVSIDSLLDMGEGAPVWSEEVAAAVQAALPAAKELWGIAQEELVLRAVAAARPALRAAP